MSRLPDSARARPGACRPSSGSITVLSAASRNQCAWPARHVRSSHVAAAASSRSRRQRGGRG
eukprot:1543420-Pleurochrysis_carterae.AAC.1